jgi:hypothetical protein
MAAWRREAGSAVGHHHQAACDSPEDVRLPACPPWCARAGQVIKPGSFKCIADEGMPWHGRPHQKGNLYVRFNVEFPDTLSEAQVRICLLSQNGPGPL